MKKYRKIVIVIAIILMVAGITTCITIYQAKDNGAIEVEKSLEDEMELDINTVNDTIK